MFLKVVAQPQRAKAAEILLLGLVSETDQEVSPKTSDCVLTHLLQRCANKHEM